MNQQHNALASHFNLYYFSSIYVVRTKVGRVLGLISSDIMQAPVKENLEFLKVCIHPSDSCIYLHGMLKHFNESKFEIFVSQNESNIMPFSK